VTVQWGCALDLPLTGDRGLAEAMERGYEGYEDATYSYLRTLLPRNHSKLMQYAHYAVIFYEWQITGCILSYFKGLTFNLKSTTIYYLSNHGAGGFTIQPVWPRFMELWFHCSWSWYQTAHYGLSQSDVVLEISVHKTPRWAGFWDNIPEQDFSSNPVLNVAVKSDQPFQLSAYLLSSAGNVIITLFTVSFDDLTPPPSLPG